MTGRNEHGHEGLFGGLIETADDAVDEKQNEHDGNMRVVEVGVGFAEEMGDAGEGVVEW